MPAGVSWPRYLRMLGASILSMFAGAQVVHQYYRPDLVRIIRSHIVLQYSSNVVIHVCFVQPELFLYFSQDYS